MEDWASNASEETLVEGGLSCLTFEVKCGEQTSQFNIGVEDWSRVTYYSVSRDIKEHIRRLPAAFPSADPSDIRLTRVTAPHLRMTCSGLGVDHSTPVKFEVTFGRYQEETLIKESLFKKLEQEKSFLAPCSEGNCQHLPGSLYGFGSRRAATFTYDQSKQSLSFPQAVHPVDSHVIPET